MNRAAADSITNKAENARLLPKDWRWVRLGEVCHVVGGTTPSTNILGYWNGDIVWITPTDLGRLRDKEILTSERLITKNGYDSCGVEIVPPDSVVMSSRAPIGHLGIAKVPLCTNQGCKSFVCGENIDYYFLYYNLKKAVPKLQALGSGATFSEISKTQLESFEIPLPPLPEQKRIAAILNEQVASVEKVRKATEQQLEAAKTLPAAYLRSVFNSPEAQKWPSKKLETIGNFESGGTPSKEKEKFWDGDIPFVTGADITDFYISKKNARAYLSQEGLNSGKTAICTKGTILFVTRTRVGRVGIATEIMGASQDLSPYICGAEILPEYACRYLLSISDYLTNSCRGATIQGLTRNFIRSIEIPLPPIKKQKIIAETLDKQIASAEIVRETLNQQLDTINKLPAALLKRAFNGEL